MYYVTYIYNEYLLNTETKFDTFGGGFAAQQSASFILCQVASVMVIQNTKYKGINCQSQELVFTSYNTGNDWKVKTPRYNQVNKATL